MNYLKKTNPLNWGFFIFVVDGVKQCCYSLFNEITSVYEKIMIQDKYEGFNPIFTDMIVNMVADRIEKWELEPIIENVDFAIWDSIQSVRKMRGRAYMNINKFTEQVCELANGVDK